jgi:sialate O-acetylesterase
MKRYFAPLLTTFYLVLLCNTLSAEVSLPAMISNGMILQRDEKINIWGWAKPGERISVEFNNKKYQTETGPDGKWLIHLDPQIAGGPYTMIIRGSNTITLNNILLGDVWVCSGQSNMTHYLGRHDERYAKEIAEANCPFIRQFLVPATAVLTGPKEDIEDIKWVEASPETVLDFTVIGYFFARKLYDKYEVPVGIINTCVGGTKIESWISEKGFKEFPGILYVINMNKDTAYVNHVNR